MSKRSLAFLMLLTLAAAALYAQTADTRVGAALDEAEVVYDVNDNGNYVVSYEINGNPERSHSVYVVSVTDEYEGIEIRELWGMGAVLDDYPDYDMLASLLEYNAGIKIGSWGMEYGENEIYLFYMVKVPAALSGKELANLIYFVAEVCDEFEEEYVGDDIY
jgi:hypothetical protein